MFGLKIENMSENGKIIKCMVKEKFNGLMEKYMKEIIKMIKNMDLELLFGLMEGNMLVIGKKGNNMVEANIIFQIKVKKLVNGSKEKE
jgi:hypothetical protein